jgi:hypothetical protein
LISNNLKAENHFFQSKLPLEAVLSLSYFWVYRILIANARNFKYKKNKSNEINNVAIWYENDFIQQCDIISFKIFGRRYTLFYVII